VSVLVVAQSSSEIPEGLMNNPVYSVNMYVISVTAGHCCCSPLASESLATPLLPPLVIVLRTK
jgi:hypothetical protein